MASSTVPQTVERGASAPMDRTMSLNSCRSSPRLIASTSAPISWTPYFSSTPFSNRPIAMLSAVWPPRVASSASGRSLAITFSTNSGVSGSMSVRLGTLGLLHQVDEPLEERGGVVRSGRGLRVELDAERRYVEAAQPLD